MIRSWDDVAISEIIGTVLMLGMAIALFASISLIIISYPLSTPSPQVDLVGFIDGSDIIFEHHGGPSLLVDTQLGITINGTTTIMVVEDYILDDNRNNRWDIGEQVVYSPGNLYQAQVEVMVIDYASNSVLMMATIQENGDGGSSPPSITTKVNSIYPYFQTESPLSLFASGSNTLDSVALYYRWSTDNWTNSWTTLTYDDFENGFGNYSDGGQHCSIYTDGSYAHQGENAVNIQDDQGDESSFYHTEGIDVDSLGYTSIKIDFWFYMHGMGSGHDFWVQYYNGSDWTLIADFIRGDDYENDQFYHGIIWINETEHIFPTDMKIKFTCDAHNQNDDVYIDEIYVNATVGFRTNWMIWNDLNNPDIAGPWSWDFDFPDGTGYYEFYSIGSKNGSNEFVPNVADAISYFNP